MIVIPQREIMALLRRTPPPGWPIHQAVQIELRRRANPGLTTADALVELRLELEALDFRKDFGDFYETLQLIHLLEFYGMPARLTWPRSVLNRVLRVFSRRPAPADDRTVGEVFRIDQVLSDLEARS